MSGAGGAGFVWLRRRHGMSPQRTQDQILRDFLRLLRRQRWLIVAFVALAAVAGVAYAVLKTPVYKASAQLQFYSEQEALSLVGTQLSPSQTPEVQVAADASVVTSPGVIQRVAKAPGIDMSAASVRSSAKDSS